MTAPALLADAAVSVEIARRLPPARAAEIAARLRRHRALWAAAHHAPTLAAWLTLAQQPRAEEVVWWHPTRAALTALAALLELATPGETRNWLLGEGRPLLQAALHSLAPDERRVPDELPALALHTGVVGGTPDVPAFVYELARDACAALGVCDDPIATHALAIQLPAARAADLLLHAVEFGGPGLRDALLAPFSGLDLPGACYAALASHADDPAALAARLPAPATIELAEALHGAGDAATAARVARAALERATNSLPLGEAGQASLAGTRALLYLLAGAASEALSTLAPGQAALERLNSRLAGLRGRALLASGDLPGAAGAFGDAVRSGPRDPEARAALAWALNALERPAEALDALSQMPEAARTSAAAAAQTGWAYHALGKDEPAARALEHALVLCAAGSCPPAVTAPIATLAAALTPGVVTPGLASAAAAACAAHPAALPLLDAAGHLHLHAEDWAGARALWIQVATLRPDDAGVQLALGRCALAQGDQPATARHFETAVALAPGDPAAHIACGEAALERGDLARALRAAEEAVAQAPGSAAARTLFGRVLCAQQQYENAAAQLTQATGLDPAHAPAWLALAEMHRKAGRQERALIVLESGQQAAPDSPELFGESAALLAGLERPTEALDAYEQAEQLAERFAPRHPERAGWAVARAELLGALGYHERALATLETAARSPRAGAAVFRDLAPALLQAGRRADAADAARRALARLTSGGPTPAGEFLATTLRASAVLCEAGDPARAVQALRDGLAINPAHHELYLALGSAYERLGSWDQALDAYRSAGRLAPNSAEVQHRVGIACRALGHTDAALVALREAALADPGNLAILADLGDTLTAAGFPAEAVEIWREVAQRRPSDGPTLVQLGAAQRRAGEPQAARETLECARAQCPDDPRIWLELGLAAQALGQTGEAVAALGRLTTLAPAPPAAMLRDAGQALLALEARDAALDCLAAAVAAEPEHAAGRVAYARGLNRAGRGALARPELEAACQLAPAEPAHRQALAELLWTLGETRPALDCWRTALELAPGDTTVLARLGRAHRALGDHAAALDCYERQIAACDAGPGAHVAAQQAYREAGCAALAAGEPARAVAHLRRAAERSPERSEVHYALGRAQHATGALDAAAESFQRAIALVPEARRYRYGLALVLGAQGHDEEALAIMDEIVRAGGQISEAQRQLGHIALRAGHYAQAVVALRAARSARPNDGGLLHAYATAVIGWGETIARRTRAHLPGEELPPGSATPPLPAGDIEEALAILRRLHTGAEPGLHAPALLRDLGRAYMLRSWKSTSAADLGAAEESLTASLAAGPGAATQRALGLVYLRTGRRREGIAALEAAVGLDPTDPLNFLEIGLAYLEANRIERACAALGRAVTLAPADAVLHHHLASALRAAGRHAEANQALAEAIEREPGVAAWHAALALGLRELDQDEAALPHLEKAVELEPAAAEYRWQLALALAASGDYLSATRALESAIQIAPDNAAWWQRLGELYIDQQLAPRAAQCFQRAHSLDPTGAAALVAWAGALLAQGERNLATQRLEQALAIEPELPDALAMLARLHLDAKRYDDAVTCLQRAADLEPGPRRAAHLVGLAGLYRQINQADRARFALEQAIAADPSMAQPYAELGDLLLQAQRFDEARQAYQQALVLAPRHVEHHVRAGRLCRLTGQLDQAITHLQRACNLSPDHSAAYHEMGRVYEERRQVERALDVYRQAISRVPHDLEGYRLAGLAYKAMKSYPDAVAMFRKAAELAPREGELYRELHRQIATMGALAFVYGQQDNSLRAGLSG
jgi:tetratricopeptide (TPR) repeat protein